MFTRQKKNYRVFVYAALIIALCVLLAAFLWPKDTAEPAGSQELSAKEGEDKNIVYRDEGLESEASDENDANEGINDDENEDDENVQASDNGQEAYYLVKRNGDGVSVFFCTPEGEEIELEKTDIVYELLTPADQKQFDTGLRAKTQEELSAILQDFAS